MKFGEEFVSQMVPEWQEAYMDYDYLKTLLKEIQLFKQRNGAPSTPKGQKRRLTLYRAFSGLTRRNNNNQPSPTAPADNEYQAILVNSVPECGTGRGRHETMFLRAAEEGGQYEMVFFRRLDDEFNKVLKFYKSKVEEVVKEAETLNKQMDGLIAFRIKVDRPQIWFDSSVEMTRLASDVAALSASPPHSGRRTSMDVIKDELSRQGQSDESSDDKEVKELKSINQHVQEQNLNIRATRPAPLEILDGVEINNTLDTPRSTVKACLCVPHQTQQLVNRENLKKVEEQLKQAFIEFYYKLRLLKSYSFLNMLAFSKIMKKYDKITSRNASKQYLKMVDNSYLGSSDEVTRLIHRVKDAFIKHFANSNRSEGMRILKPKAKKEKHGVTFLLGFFVGCTVALILALVLIIRARNIIDKEGGAQYMENMFPLYSLFGFIILHMLMYAANIYFWRRYRVNYSFIFGFKEGTELGYREVLLLSSAFAILALASVLANLDMEMDPETLDYKAITELVPLGLVVLVIIILLCPFNIIYRSSRFFLLKSVFHCIFAPLYKVTVPDFFLADQLSSQVQALRSLEFYVCYYGWGDYKLRENSCKTNDVYNTFCFIVAAIPNWLRLLQCLRCFYVNRDVTQGLNGLKHFWTIVAVSTRTAYTFNTGSISWRMVAWIFSVNAAIFGTYWDLVKDWGLLQLNSENPWLRDKLLVPHKSVYFGAMVLNVVLRFAWLQTVFDFNVPFLHRETLVALVAVLEIFRRGIWNFFRLENEYLNNVDNYRAINSVSLPFNYDEDENKYE